MTADDIIAAARLALDIQFRHQGRGVRGLDCAGLVVFVAQALGIEHTDVDGYSPTPSGGLLESALDGQACLMRVDRREMQAGDILLMRFAGDPQHLAIFTGENIIHSYSEVGKVCEHRLSDVWAARIVRVYRFVGVES